MSRRTRPTESVGLVDTIACEVIPDMPLRFGRRSRERAIWLDALGWEWILGTVRRLGTGDVLEMQCSVETVVHGGMLDLLHAPPRRTARWRCGGELSCHLWCVCVGGRLYVRVHRDSVTLSR